MEVAVTNGDIRTAKLPSNRHHQYTNIQLYTGRSSDWIGVRHTVTAEECNQCSTKCLLYLKVHGSCLHS